MKDLRTSDKKTGLRRMLDGLPAPAASRDIVRDILADIGPGGKITHRTGTHIHQYHGVAVSPDGSRMITANRDHTARLWDIASGQCLMVFHGHTDELRRAAFTNDGRYAATCANDGTLRLWNCTTGACVLVLNGHKGNVTAITVSPDDKYLVSGGADGTLRLWSLPSGACDHVVTPTGGPIARALITKDGGTLVTLDSNGTVYRWAFPDVRKPFRIIEGRFPNRVGDIALAGDGKLVGAAWKGLYCFDMRTGAQERYFPLEPCKPYRIAATPDGTRFVVCCHFKTILVVKAGSGTIERQFGGHNDDITDMALSSDGKILCTASLDWTCRIWDIRRGECLRTIKPAWNVFHLSLSGDGKCLFAFDAGGTAKAWNLADASQRVVSRGNVWSVAFLALPNLIVTGHKDGMVRLWDGQDGKTGSVAAIKAHKGPVSCLVPLGSGTSFVTCAYDGTLKLWDTEKRDCIRSCSISGKITTFAIDENTQRIAVCRAFEKRIYIHDLRSGDRIAVLEGHTWAAAPNLSVAIRCLRFLPHGKGLVSCGHDGRVILWDPAALEAVRTIEEAGCPILSMAVENDGRHILTGTFNKGIKRWDLEHGQQETCHPYEGLPVLSVALSPDEKTLFAAFGDGTVRIIDRGTSALLCAVWNVDNGFFWFSPSDEHAPDGWVWTDRDDLLHVVEQDNGGRVLGAVPLNDENRRAYVRTRNNAAMVQSRLKGLEAYTRTAGQYLRALEKNQREAAARARPMLPKGNGNA